MTKRVALAAGGLAVTLAAAMPVSGAFGCIAASGHCQKVSNAISTAVANVTSTNSGQSGNVQQYLQNSLGKCA